MSGWINVEDKMPEFYQKIIFWHSSCHVQMGRVWTEGVMVNGYLHPYSHWMPIPELPKK